MARPWLIPSPLVVGILCLGCSAPTPSAYLDVDARLANAHRLASANRHAQAAAAFASFATELRHRDQRARLAQFWAGEEYSKAARFDDALDAFSALHKHFPDSGKLLDDADRSCLDMGQRLLAAANPRGLAFLEAVTDWGPSPVAPDAHLALGQYYYARSRFADALFEFDRVVRDYPGTDHVLPARLAAALCEYHLVDRPPRNLAHLANAQRRLRDLRSAPLGADDMARVDRCLRELDNLAAESHLLMAQFYLKQGTVTPAIHHLREILERYAATPHSDRARELILLIDREADKAPEK